MAEQKLAGGILARSRSKNWHEARHEWALIGVELSDTPRTCLCGHHPIRELCFIRNRFTGESAVVGNHCVHKFLASEAGAVFSSAKRVKQNRSSSIGMETLQHALSKGWISEWEFRFYVNIGDKRKLTEKQLAKKQEINQKFLWRLMNRS